MPVSGHRGSFTSGGYAVHSVVGEGEYCMEAFSREP